MKLNLDLNNQTKPPIKKIFFNAVVKKTLAEFFGHPMSLDRSDQKTSHVRVKNISVSIALVGKEEIKRLNKVYRKKNQVTDILSFAEYRSERALRKRVEMGDKEEIFLGELILCYDDIREYAEKKKIKLDKELANVVSHGVLHLLGMKHGKKMFGIQEKICNG